MRLLKILSIWLGLFLPFGAAAAQDLTDGEIRDLTQALLFAPEEGTKSMDEVMSATKEAVMKEKNTADVQRRFEVLSNELKSSNCLTPRRISQTTNNTIEIRIWKNMEKSLQDMRLRGVNQLHRVSQHISTYQIINLSTLLCRMGEHVFALRKLII